MPSREVLEVLAVQDNTNAGAKSDSGSDDGARVVDESENQSDVLATAAAFNTAESTESKKRKITPGTTSKNKNAATSYTKKGKQMTLASFFSKGTVPSSPGVTTNKVAKKQTSVVSSAKSTHKTSSTKKQNGKTSASQNTKPAGRQQPLKSCQAESSTKLNAAASVRADGSSTKNASRHDKMKFKDVIVGNLDCRKTVDGSAKPIMSTAASKKAAATNDDKLDSILPRILPLSTVKSFSKMTSAKPDDGNSGSGPLTMIKSALSQEDSEASGEGMGALRSQLVHKFENSPSDNVPEKAREVSAPDTSVDDDKVADSTDAAVEVPEFPTKDMATKGSEAERQNKDCFDKEKMPAGDIINIDSIVHDETNDCGPVAESENTTVAASHVKRREDTRPFNKGTRERDTSDSANAYVEIPTNDVNTTDDKTTTLDRPEKAECSEAATYTNQPQLSHLQPEYQALLYKHEAMKLKYCEQASKLVALGHNGLDEEDALIAMPSTDNITLPNDVSSDFPDVAVPHLVSLLEGSPLPLSELAKKSCYALTEAFAGYSFSSEIISAKIKVLASRKPYFKNPYIGSGKAVSNTLSKEINIFEDVNSDHMWRWETTTLDLLPDISIKTVKQARSARRKLQLQFNATAKLLAALDESIKLLGTSDGNLTKSNIEKSLGLISREEEKVLKYLQEAEKARLLAEAKKMKHQKSNEEKVEKQREKEERKREKEEAKQKKALEAKREKEEKEKAEQIKKDREIEKQKKRMLSFFAGPSKKPKGNDSSPKPAVKSSTTTDKLIAPSNDGFDSEKFRSSINSQVDEAGKFSFESLSARAIASRRPKSKRVKMRVFVLGQSPDADSGFCQQAFSEERIVEVRDRNKFLSFTEDCRPPYHGTWSKRSGVKNLGRKPFFKEPSLDYDVDSEDEWEEGDDDPGEDVENDAGDDEDEKIVDEEGDIRAYNYQDGWLAQDDDLGVEDAEMDEETKKLLMASKRQRDGGFVPVCIVAPANGVPFIDKYDCKDPSVQQKVEGFPVEEAYSLINSHIGTIVAETDIFLDAFPPALVDERDSPTEPSTSLQSNNEPSAADMQVFARFVHHSTLVSKSQVVEELRSAHSTVTASRAQAHRVLDSIAEKKRHPQNGVYWEVKKDVIDTLGLADELKPMQLNEPQDVPKKESKKRNNTEGPENDQKAKKKPRTKATDGTPKSKGSAKKPQVSAASKNLLAAFLGKK